MSNCGGFTCTKNSLIGLNILYMLVAFLLIGVAAYGKTASIISSVSVVGGIVACGVFLLFIAVLGLLGATRHSQVLLFFYMIVLLLLFLMQFCIACACLAVNGVQQDQILLAGWKLADNNTKTDAQEYFQCCGYNTTHNPDAGGEHMVHPPCPTTCCPQGTPAEQCCMNGTACSCQACMGPLKEAISSGIRASGGIGLFFSFTELAGFILAFLFRRQADPERVQVIE